MRKKLILSLVVLSHIVCSGKVMADFGLSIAGGIAILSTIGGATGIVIGVLSSEQDQKAYNEGHISTLLDAEAAKKIIRDADDLSVSGENTCEQNRYCKGAVNFYLALYNDQEKSDQVEESILSLGEWAEEDGGPYLSDKGWLLKEGYGNPFKTMSNFYPLNPNENPYSEDNITKAGQLVLAVIKTCYKNVVFSKPQPCEDYFLQNYFGSPSN